MPPSPRPAVTNGRQASKRGPGGPLPRRFTGCHAGLVLVDLSMLAFGKHIDLSVCPAHTNGTKAGGVILEAS